MNVSTAKRPDSPRNEAVAGIVGVGFDAMIVFFFMVALRIEHERNVRYP